MNVFRMLIASSGAIILASFWCPLMTEAATRLPLIELEKQPKPAPAGYRWYILRDWEHVHLGKASGVARGERVSAAFAADALVFQQRIGDTLRQRKPKSPGEVSHILLPESFQLPPDVAALDVGPPPTTLSPKPSVNFSNTGFQEEPLPPGAPPGYKAYTFVHPGLVFSGTATEIEGGSSSFVLSGHDLTIRRSERPGERSHVLLPSHMVLPAATRRLQ